MVGAAHLGSWQLYNNKFLEYYTKDVGEHFRFPNVSEAEEADQQAMREIFSLCFNGVNLDDALSSVAVDRDMLRQLLFPRPKLSLKPREKEPLKRSRPGDKPGSGGNAKHLKNGECFHWCEGKCKNEPCKRQVRQCKAPCCPLQCRRSCRKRSSRRVTIQWYCRAS